MSKQQIFHRIELEHCFIIAAKLLATHSLQPFVVYRVPREVGLLPEGVGWASFPEGEMHFYASKAAATRMFSRLVDAARETRHLDELTGE